jgi:hypothetical protein
MEPATLYLVFKVGGGPEKTYRGLFPHTVACERALARMLERKSPEVTCVRSLCWEHGTPAPDWIAEKRIHGVPLHPKYMPTG